MEKNNNFIWPVFSPKVGLQKGNFCLFLAGALYGVQFDRLDVVFQILIEDEKEIAFIRFVEYHSGNLAKRPKLNCEKWLQRALETLEKINEEKNKNN